MKISLAVTLAFLAVTVFYEAFPEFSPVLASLAERSLDYKFQFRGPQPTKSKIVVVAADEKTVQALGRPPFDRGAVIAPLFEKLCGYSTKVVAFDAIFSHQERLFSGKLKEGVEGLLGKRAGELDALIARSGGNAILKKALERCGGKALLGYALLTAERGVPREQYLRRLSLLTDPGARNALASEVPPAIEFARFRGEATAKFPFYFVAKSGVLNLPEVTPANLAQGFLNFEEDSDGRYRHSQMMYRAEGAFLPSFALRMAQKVLSADDASGRVSLEGNLLRVTLAGSGRKLPLNAYGQALVNYRGPNGTFLNVSLSDVLDSNPSIEYGVIDALGKAQRLQARKDELFKDAAVIIGFTSQGPSDMRPRPFDSTAMGVENQASVLDNLLNDDFLETPLREHLLPFLAIALAASLLFGWALTRLDAKAGAAFAVLVAVGLFFFDQLYLFNAKRIVFFSWPLQAQLGLQFLLISVAKYVRVDREKKLIRSAFDKYVSPAVIDTMLKDPSRLKLGGEKKDLSVLFSDIRGFTSLSEELDVKQLTGLLNEYLGEMTRVLTSNEGTLDKYIGDAVMGFWGAPLRVASHARLSVKTAVEMLGKLEALNDGFSKKYGRMIEIGIGINSGPVSVGNFGSDEVFEYTVIGDNVNLASRLEGLNKKYGTMILISEQTFRQLEPGAFFCREIDSVKVKGKHQAVKIFEVHPKSKKGFEAFENGLKNYYGRRWREAIADFDRALQEREGDGAAQVMKKRCESYLESAPPADWDGSFEMDSK